MVRQVIAIRDLRPETDRNPYCSIEDPCNSCPRLPSNSPWSAVGCKRGSIRSQMLPTVFCPRSQLVSSHAQPPDSELPGEQTDGKDSHDAREAGNVFARQNASRRMEKIRNYELQRLGQVTLLDSFLRSMKSDDLDQAIVERLRNSPLGSVTLPIPSSGVVESLYTSICEISLELLSCSDFRLTLENGGDENNESLVDIAVLLCAAALWQSESNLVCRMVLYCSSRLSLIEVFRAN
jgi:hypothetical protein